MDLKYADCPKYVHHTDPKCRLADFDAHKLGKGRAGQCQCQWVNMRIYKINVFQLYLHIALHHIENNT